MFSDNQKISSRQTFRFLLLASIGSAVLAVPGILAKKSGNGGIYSILAAFGIIFFYLLFAGKMYEKKENEMCPLLGKLTDSASLLVFAVSGSFFLVQQTILVKKMLLPSVPCWLLALIFLLVCTYGAFNGPEDLARISEVLFYLILLLVVSLFMVTWNRVPGKETLKTVTETESVSSILSGAVSILPFLLPFLLLPKQYSEIADLKKGKQRAMRSLVIFCLFLIVLYYFCVGIFGVSQMKEQLWPFVDLMKEVRLPGGLFGKVDTFFSMIVILGLFFLISQLLILWSKGCKSISGRNAGKWFLMSGSVIFFAGTLFFGTYRSAEEKYLDFMKYFGLWVIPAKPLLEGVWLLLRGKRGTFKALAFILCLTGASCVLNGCSESLEQREFVLAMGIGTGENGYNVTYAFPELAKVSDQGGSIENRTSYTADVPSLFQADENYASKTDKEPDYNHLKAVVIEKELLESETFQREFISLGLDERLERDVKIFLCEGKAADLLEAARAEQGSAGIYLEALCKNAKCLKEKEVISVGEVCFFATENKREMVRAKAENLVLPVLEAGDDRPTISQIIEIYN